MTDIPENCEFLGGNPDKDTDVDNDDLDDEDDDCGEDNEDDDER